MAARPPSVPRRKATIRYPGHDYSEPGTYFVTICTQGRRQLFGHVRDNALHPNDVAAMVEEVWQRLPQRYPGIVLDAMIIMPDHLQAFSSLAPIPAS